LAIVVHEPPAHLYASVTVLEKSCITKHVRAYLTHATIGVDRLRPVHKSGAKDARISNSVRKGKRTGALTMSMAAIAAVSKQQVPGDAMDVFSARD